MKNNRAIFTGLLAGLAAGLMVLGAFNAGVFAFVLFFAAPAAVYIASMGWGSLAGIIAALAGAGLSAVFGESSIAGLALILLFGPAAFVGHLTNLGQRGEGADGKSFIVWYPLSLILLRLMLVLAAGFLLVGYLAGYTQEQAALAFGELMKQIGSANPDLPQLDDDVVAARAELYAGVIPLIVPCIWLLMHVLTAFVSAGITRRSGLLAREEEDIAGTVSLPFEASGFIGVGLGLMLLFGGPVSLIGSVLLGIGIGGYALIGLADMHHRTRPMASRGVILGIAYGSIILFSAPLIIFTVMGLMRSMRTPSNNPPNSGSGSTGPNNSNT